MQRSAIHIVIIFSIVYLIKRFQVEMSGNGPVSNNMLSRDGLLRTRTYRLEYRRNVLFEIPWSMT